MTPADLDHVLEEVADVVMHCEHLAIKAQRLAVKLEIANLVRRELKRRLVDQPQPKTA